MCVCAFMALGGFTCVCMCGAAETAVPIKRCPCCNQCTEALGPICCHINLELIEVHSAQTHAPAHIQARF